MKKITISFEGEVIAKLDSAHFWSEYVSYKIRKSHWPFQIKKFCCNYDGMLFFIVIIQRLPNYNLQAYIIRPATWYRNKSRTITATKKVTNFFKRLTLLLSHTQFILMIF